MCMRGLGVLRGDRMVQSYETCSCDVFCTSYSEVSLLKAQKDFNCVPKSSSMLQLSFGSS